MAADASATLTANAQATTAVFVPDRATYAAVISSTITVTRKISHDQTNWAPYAAGLTASGAGVVWGPCWLRLIASAVTGGSAICSVQKAF